ncbi:Cochaperone protein [Lithohypha guttulata]|uniref:Cochaperone protein n=1 Tax=Lithohypha guttulata TaxID=1690604 RepID=A0AAN7T3I0_9EURO|nr:Cochaperone protein [Lithohypha guttulata]
MDHASAGAKALAVSDAKTAVEEYTKALIENPTSPDYFIQRSTAFGRLNPPRHDLALQDAEFGVLAGQKRGKRDKIQAAQQRRVVALYNLERYADAKLVLDSMKRWRPTNSKPQEMEHNMWQSKIDGKLKTKPQEATVTEYPSTSLPNERTMTNLLEKQLQNGTASNQNEKDVEVQMVDDGGKERSTTEQPSTTAPTTSTTESTPATVAPPQNFRHEWYQNNQNVIVTIYAKGVQKDKVEVDIEEDSISVTFPHPSDPSSSFNLSFDPLCALIDPSASKSQVMSTKIELTLAKAAQGQKWANIEGSAPLKKSEAAPTEDASAQAAMMSSIQQPPAPAAAPSYPTSSKTGPKNWDKLASDLTKKPKKSTPKSEKHDEDEDEDDSDADDAEVDDDSDFGGDAVDGFFKKLYAGADPDTKRAMMKSFTESNGTALSTNWSDVGKKKVEEVKSRDEEN